MEELEQEELDKELLGVGPSASDELPEVPNDEIKEKAKQKKKGSFTYIPLIINEYIIKFSFIEANPEDADEDKELKQLLSWAN